MSAKFKPGQIVKINRATFNSREDFLGVILYEEEPESCMLCGDDECVEWANVLSLDGKMYHHIPECRMEKHPADT